MTLIIWGSVTQRTLEKKIKFNSIFSIFSLLCYDKKDMSFLKNLYRFHLGRNLHTDRCTDIDLFNNMYSYSRLVQNKLDNLNYKSNILLFLFIKIEHLIKKSINLLIFTIIRSLSIFSGFALENAFNTIKKIPFNTRWTWKFWGIATNLTLIKKN